MKTEIIKESEAPQPPKPMSKVATEITGVLNKLKAGQVAKVTPEEGQSIRGLKTSFGRVASGQKIKIMSWSVEGDEAIYVKRLEK